MKLSRTLKSMLDDAGKTDAYWAEHAKLEFSITLEQRRRAAKLSYADIARKMGTSAAYITKVFRGDSNMTIETLVRLARACDGQLDIQVVDGALEPGRWDSVRIKGKNAPVTAPGGTVTYADFQPAIRRVSDGERNVA